MKQVLEALETCQIYADGWHGPDYMFDDSKVSQAITTLRQAIAEAEKQEPVAWWDEKIGVFNEKHFDQLKPLYIHPPKHEWQGLTDELMYQLANEVGFDAELMQRNHDKGFPSIAELFAKAIDAKLRERNK